MDMQRPRVKTRTGKTRGGRGFSRTEFEKAGWDPEIAFGHDVAFDPRRKTCHEGNVAKLKALKEAAG